MPPKKKEEEIDPSTLPPCKSIAVRLAYLGKKDRANKLIEIIHTKPFHFQKTIDRKDIIDHAKEKGFYTDPATLTDKQKKDPKVMSQLVLQLTPQVLGKAAVSFFKNIQLKYRIELKNKLQGKQQKQDKKGSKKDSKKGVKQQPQKQPQPPQKQFQKNFDLLILFQNYPNRGQYQEYLKQGGSLLCLDVIMQKIQWLNDMDQQQYFEDGKQNQQENNIALVKEAESMTQADKQFNKVQQQIISILNHQKKECLPGPLLDIFVNQISFQYDPYATADKQIQQFHQIYIQQICNISNQYQSFIKWKQPKKTQSFQYHTEQKLNKTAFQNKIQQIQIQSRSTYSFLNQIAKMVQKTYIQSIQANQSSQRISQIKAALNHSYISTTQKNPINNSNGYRRPNQIDDTKQQQSINLLKLPGCNRQLMPKHPTRSAALRLQRRSRLTPFVTGNFKDFQLQLSLVYFQNMLRQQPEQRSYDLGQFYHMQRLTQNRLRNKLYNILKLQPTVISKYNQKEDRLYLILYQRTPKGRTLRKGWQNQWSVLPNFESWIKYFKNNQQNFNKQTFFDLDLRKYGRHSDRLKVFFPAQKNTILFVRQFNLGNSVNHSTWINKNQLEFGINQKGFWAQVQGVKVTTQYKDRKWSLSIQTKHGNIIIILPGCSIYQKHYKYKNLISCKTLLSGHIIIYGKERKIIHPGGQLTIGRPFQVINKKGLGVKQQNSSLTQWPTVTRCLNGISFSKRQDGSKITIKGQQQWNQFENFKMHKIGQILHIQRQQFSSYTVKINNRIEAKLGKLKISASNQSQGQLFQVQLPDKTWLSLKNNNISLRPQDQSNLYSIDLSTKQIIFEDSQHNVFRVDAQGKCNCIFSNPIIYNQDQKRPNTPPFQVKQYIQEQVQSLPLPALQIQPRLFIVEGNGTGIEFHNKNLLLEQGIRINKQSCIDSQKEQYININQVKQDMLKQKSVMQIPRIKDLDLLKLTQKTQKQQTKHNYIVLQQTKGKQFLDREPFRKTLSEYFQWKKQFIKSYNQFGHIKRQQAQQKTDHAIMSKIMEFRQRHKQPKGTSMDFLESVQLFQNYLVQQQKKKKAQQQANRVQQKIQEQQPKIIKKSRPDRQNNQESISKIKGQFFAANYFQTNAGQQFLKNNPGMPSSKKIVKPILQAPQDISKIQAAAQQPQQSEPAQQISKFQSKQQNIQSIILKPSVFTKAQIDQQRRQLQQQKACYKARQLRHKQYDVYQQPRKDIPIPFSVLRSNPKSQLNQKYILTQTITDRKIKISSMKNKISTKSPSTQQQRAQGSHHPLMKTFDKKYQYQELLDRKSMMIQADINDRLRRDVLIYPTQAEFGRLKVGCLYQIKISIKNQDSISQRIHISQIKNPNIHVCLSRTGPIALGINTEVIIRIQANESARGKFSQEFQIITKHQIYQIPVRGIIVPEQVYDRQQKEERMAGLSQSKGFVKLIGNLNQNSEYSILPKLKKEQPQYL